MSDNTAEGRTGPLAGLRVVDLTHMLAGPYCTWLLGALGADVIKVEMPGRGDFTRGIAPFLDGESIYFLSVNRNKRSITLNLKHPAGRAALLRLIEKADVMVENNRPGVMARLKLDYPNVSAINPRLVYASVSGFGQTGPYRERPALDVVVQAMGGMMSITGNEGGPPARAGASIGDMTASLFAAVGILSAITERATTGRGAYVDVAMLDAQVAILENAIARFLNTGDVPRRLGTRHPLVVPFQAFPTKDEPVIVCVDTAAQWSRFCETIDRRDLIEHPDFIDSNARTRNHARLEPILIEALSRRTRAEWLAAFEAIEIPTGPINDVPTVVEDPQVRARGMIVEAGKGRFAAQPVHLSSHPRTAERPAPALGAHTDEVLREAGFTAAEIDSMRAEGAI